MTAYLIGHISVKDHAKWADYRSKVPATLAPWGATVVLRGTGAEVLCGQHHHTDTVVIAFPAGDSIAKWYNSHAYQALIPLRTQAAEMDLITYASA